MSCDVGDGVYNFVNELLEKVREIEDLIDRFEIELVNDELGERLKNDELIKLEKPEEIEKLLQEDN